MNEDQYLESYWESDMFGNVYCQPDQESDDSFYRGIDDEEEEEEEVDTLSLTEDYLEKYGRPDYCDF